MEAVACGAAGSCAAIGEYTDNDGNGDYVIDTLAAGIWTATEAPRPPNASDYFALTSVACKGAGSCVAVGTYGSDTIDNLGLIETLAGGVWTPREAPAGPGSGPEQSSLEALVSVACGAAGSCVAVGSYIDSNGSNHLLFETLQGGVWTPSQASLPADATDAEDASLISVSCGGAGSCAVSGSYLPNPDSSVRGFIEALSNGTWTAITLPLPSNHGGSEYSQITSIACGAVDFCAAVGDYTDSNDNFQVLTEVLSKGVLTATQAPTPANAVSPSGSESSVENSVSCGAASSCVAVGFYLDSDGAYMPLIQTLSGEGWTAIEGPLPPNGTTGNLSSVSCSGPRSCAAAGFYGSGTQGLIETEP
jgi:hypothetical protein